MDLQPILEDLQDPLKSLRLRIRTRNNQRYRIVPLVVNDGDQVSLFANPIADPRTFLVRCEDLGLPQARHRLIVLGIREDIGVSSFPVILKKPRIGSSTVLADLPRLRSGLSRVHDSAQAWDAQLKSIAQDPWFDRFRRDSTVVADCMLEAVNQPGHEQLSRGGGYLPWAAKPALHAEWFHDTRLKGIVGHSTRAHIASDLKRYLFAAAYAKVNDRSPRLSEFPRWLLPKHRNLDQALEGAMFEDRFRVQLAHHPSTTVTAHISKDGHYYIHYDPAQCRSLTPTEAARLQTFPDNYLFCGGRTAQYIQIGNAVPPLLARHISHVVAGILR